VRVSHRYCTLDLLCDTSGVRPVSAHSRIPQALIGSCLLTAVRIASEHRALHKCQLFRVAISHRYKKSLVELVSFLHPPRFPKSNIKFKMVAFITTAAVSILAVVPGEFLLCCTTPWWSRLLAITVVVVVMAKNSC